MYYVCKPTKIQIYVNSGYKSIVAIQKELGCDVIVNGGLYDMKWFTPYCWLRADGKTLHEEGWSDWGFGWSNYATTNTDGEAHKGVALTMDTSDNAKLYRNFISCVALIRNGKAITPLSYDPALGGKRGRTAIGVRANGEVVVYCTQDGTTWALTPESLQKEMQDIGAVSALMLDGGASSQCIMPIGTVKSSRIVQNYIAIWTGKAPENANPQKPECPYAEPKNNIRWGGIGNGAKWVQWQLRRHGIMIDVDGLFFGQSVSALRSFQVAHGLTSDGVCGPLTREALKK